MIEFHTNFVERREHSDYSSSIVPRDVSTFLRRNLFSNSDVFPIVRSPLNIMMCYGLRLSSRSSSVMFSHDAPPKFPLQKVRNTNLKNE